MPLIYCDFNQGELWITALEANDLPFLAVRERGEYIHGIVYEDLFKPELFFEKDKPKKKEFRLKTVDGARLLRAKAVPHGFNYNRQPGSLAKEHNWAESVARKYHTDYFTIHWAIKDWHKKIENEVVKNGLLRNRFGRIRRYPLKDNSIYSYKPQSGLADILIRAIPRICTRLQSPSRILLPVHDSVLAQASWKDMLSSAETISSEMERPVSVYGGFVFETELKIGMNWKDMDDENPLGLRPTTLQNLPEGLNELEKGYRSSKTAYSFATGREV